MKKKMRLKALDEEESCHSFLSSAYKGARSVEPRDSDERLKDPTSIGEANTISWSFTVISRDEIPASFIVLLGFR